MTSIWLPKFGPGTSSVNRMQDIGGGGGGINVTSDINNSYSGISCMGYAKMFSFVCNITRHNQVYVHCNCSTC